MSEREEARGKPRPARVRAVPWKTATEDKVRGALGEIPAYVRRARRLEEAVARPFSEAAEAPLDEVNAEVEGYNEHYAFEKQCAVRYVPLNKLGADERRPLTEADLLERFPLLPEA